MSERLHFLNRYCPQIHAAVPADQRRFAVEITRPDGTKDLAVAIGGDSFGHAVDAIGRAGECARISVRQLPALQGGAS